MDWFWLLKEAARFVAIGAVILYFGFFLMNVTHHIASREEDTKKLHRCLNQISDSIKELERLQESQGKAIAEIAKQVLPQDDDDDWPTGGPLEFRADAAPSFVGGIQTTEDRSILERYISAKNQRSPDLDRV